MTFNEHGAAMVSQIEALQGDVGRSDAGRDLALSLTHLEDALTRFNSAQYRIAGTWKRADPEKGSA